MAPHLFALAAASLLLAAPCLALHSSVYDNLLSKAQVCLQATYAQRHRCRRLPPLPADLRLGSCRCHLTLSPSAVLASG